MHVSDILAAMEWVQPNISFFGEMFLNAAPSHSNLADTDPHSYNSNLEFGLRVFNCYSCYAPRFQYECGDSHTKLIQYQKIKAE